MGSNQYQTRGVGKGKGKRVGPERSEEFVKNAYIQVSRQTGVSVADLKSRAKIRNATGSHSQIAYLEKVSRAHRDKPPEWMPENHFDPKKFVKFDHETPEVASTRKAWWESHTKARDQVINTLKNADHIPPIIKQQYAEAAQKSLSYMPKAALDSIADNVAGVQWHLTTAQLSKAISSDAKLQAVGAWQVVQGQNKGVLFLNGDGKGAGAIREVYSHEFGHVVDWKPSSVTITKTGTHHEKASAISATSEWREAFKAELSSGQLSEYGATVEHEGFAEFARHAWSGVRPKDIEADFPLSYAVFKKHGLVR